LVVAGIAFRTGTVAFRNAPRPKRALPQRGAIFSFMLKAL
jgi:hypothetical protein